MRRVQQLGPAVVRVSENVAAGPIYVNQGGSVSYQGMCPVLCATSRASNAPVCCLSCL